MPVAQHGADRVTSSVAVATWLAAAGFVAGVVGTAGGITSLVSYPALLAAGLPPLQANVVNLVAGTACWPGSALTSRRELAGTGAWLARALPVAAVGATAGALLLLSTPPGLFTRLVPVLVVIGSLALVATPALVDRRARRRGMSARQDASRLTLPGVGVLSVYAGYFGAGSGIMLLALVLVLLELPLPAANALKNMLLGATSVAAASVLVLVAPVDWSAVAPLAVGLIAGSTLGPTVTRRVPAHLVRWTAAALGLLLALRLWLSPG